MEQRANKVNESPIYTLAKWIWLLVLYVLFTGLILIGGQNFGAIFRSMTEPFVAIARIFFYFQFPYPIPSTTDFLLTSILFVLLIVVWQLRKLLQTLERFALSTNKQ